MQREDVKSAFHATRKQGPWLECNGQVGAQFFTRTSAPAVRLLPKLLEQIPILMFAGAEDLICVSWQRSGGPAIVSRRILNLRVIAVAGCPSADLLCDAPEPRRH